MTYSREEIEWVAGGIHAYLIAKAGTDEFPEELYEKAKELIGYGKR